MPLPDHGGNIPALHAVPRSCATGFRRQEMRPDEIRIPVGNAQLGGSLDEPEGSRALLSFAHGSGSSRHSPRNQSVAAAFREAGFGTLLFDLLTSEEESLDRVTAQLRFNSRMRAD